VKWSQTISVSAVDLRASCQKHFHHSRVAGRSSEVQCCLTITSVAFIDSGAASKEEFDGFDLVLVYRKLQRCLRCVGRVVDISARAKQ
jgi:hypothetical protein